METMSDKHENGCSPSSPCSRCTAITFLKSQFSEQDLVEILNILRQGEELLFSQTIDSLDLTVITLNVLKNEGVTTVAGLMELTENQLLRFPNLERRSVIEIVEVLSSRGLTLAK